MTGDEVRKFRQGMDMSRREFAIWAGWNGRHACDNVARMECGEKPVSETLRIKIKENEAKKLNHI